MAKKRTSFALSETATQLLAALAAHIGLTLSGTLEVLIRDRARREGLVKPPSPPP